MARKVDGSKTELQLLRFCSQKVNRGHIEHQYNIPTSILGVLIINPHFPQRFAII